MDYVEEENELLHIGIKRKSGRYPWGSGQNEYERSRGFKSYMAEMKSKGLTDKQIADALSTKEHPLTTSDIRAAVANSTEHIRAENIGTATKLAAKGMGASAIAAQMSTPHQKINESTVRGWLKPAQDRNDKSIQATANLLKDQLKEKKFLDVGKGTNLFMGISDVKLRVALASLRDEGYEVWSGIKVPQLGTDKLTNYKVLTEPGMTWKDAAKAVRQGDLKIIAAQSDDGGLTYKTEPKGPPVSLNSKRLEIRYKEDGGDKMDGVIELRRGVDDISLGGNKYAQVRVAVDGTHYLKGMAMYADNLPPGVDVRFNTNKTKEEASAKGPLGALKDLKTTKDGAVDHDNPFGATTHPHFYSDAKGTQKVSPLRIVNEEGKWDDWSKSLSSQMLSKQSLGLAAKQLQVTRDERQKEFEKILAMTNPVVKKQLLLEFADSADSAAVHLKAAALPRQASRVILPMNSMRPNEIFAPDLENGQRVVLVRYPHGGPFEIPELTVNNRNLTARRIMGGALDAVGIHHSVAEQLSGADFDGDSVLVIPNDNRAVKTRPPLEQLKGFDPKTQYKIPDDDKVTPRMTKDMTQKEMGKVSNLITDMNIRGAPDDEMAKAVKHSMVVIDAEKHGLDYKRSENDQSIKALKKKYQSDPTNGKSTGASTIISKAGSDERILERKQLSGDRGINPKTGEKVFVNTDRKYQKPIYKKDPVTGEKVPTGEFETVPRMTKGTKGEFVKDAFDLSSHEPMEDLYASHANSMKALANRARLASLGLKGIPKSKAAETIYASEVASLNAKLQVAERNAPLERRAQVVGNAMARARIDASVEHDKDTIKKIKYQSLADARELTGAGKVRIGALDEHGHSTLTDREWEAIQAGAIAPTTLHRILANADMNRVKELASPKPRTSLTVGQLSLARQMRDRGEPISAIAERLGLPRSTVADNLKAK